jgi:Phage integrase, N-terminal SAM-like domain
MSGRGKSVGSESVPRDEDVPAAVAAFLAGYSGHTRVSYATDLRIFADWCQEGGLRLFDLRRSHLELFGRWMEENGRMRSTVARRLSTLVRFYRYCEYPWRPGPRGCWTCISGSGPAVRSSSGPGVVGWTATPRTGWSNVWPGEPGSPRPFRLTACVILSLRPHLMPGSRCETYKRPRLMPIRGRPCATTAAAGPSTGTPPTSSPPSSPGPPADLTPRPGDIEHR